MSWTIASKTPVRSMWARAFATLNKRERHGARFLNMTLICALAAHPGLTYAQVKKAIEQPAHNVELRASLDGKHLTTLQDIAQRGPQWEKRTAEEIEKYSVKLKLDQSIQLKVELIEQGKPPVDVTRSPYIFYSTDAPWRLTVTTTGMVTAKTAKDWTAAADPVGKTGSANVLVAYEQGKKLGFIVIPVSVME